MKKIVSLVVASAMFISSGIVVIAKSPQEMIDVKTEISRAQNGISDLPITEEILNQIQVKLTDSNGNEVPVEMNATVRKLSNSCAKTFSLNQVQSNLSEMYAITVLASTKTSSDSDSDDSSSVGASAYITMFYIDNFFAQDELTGISGGWSKSSSSVVISEKKVEYGSMDPAGGVDGKHHNFYPSGNTFDVSNLSIKSNTIGLKSTAKVSNGSNTDTLTCSVARM